MEYIYADSVDPSSFISFDPLLMLTECAGFHGINPFQSQGRKERMMASPVTFETEQKCHTFTSSLPTDVKLKLVLRLLEKIP